jgi:vacuolar-type H+-ATPase subunit E/Vma4
MGVEDIIAVIAREADEEASRIVDEAERQAQQVVDEAEAEVQAQVDAAIERQGAQIRGAAQRRVNAARLQILEQRARDDAARLVAVFDAAEEQVGAIASGSDSERWAAAMSALCAEALDAVGAGGSVRVRARDADAISSVAEAGGAEVVLVPDETEPGLVVSSSDGRIEVDARLSVRLERARSLLAEAVAQHLQLEPVERLSRSAA